MNQVPKYLSIVIPCFNEEQRLEKAFKILKPVLLKHKNWKVILVNDGSTDNTEKLIKGFSGATLISYVKNQGKGYALKQGVLNVKQPLVLLCDIDFSTPLTELPKLYEKIATAEMVIGSRKTLGANIVKHQPWWREFLGKQFTNLSKIILGLKVSDVTCGFKLMKNQTAKQLFNLSRINRWGYDAEILFIAKIKNIKIADVPVMWENDERTKVSVLKDIFLSLKELGLIKINYWSGKYKN